MRHSRCPHKWRRQNPNRLRAGQTTHSAMRYWLGLWAFYYGLYLVLAGKTIGDEMSSGFVTSFVCAWITLVLIRRDGHLFASRIGWLFKVLSQLPKAVMDSVKVTAAALAPTPPRGSISVNEFDSGTDRPEDATRRAVVVERVCIAPNSVVLDCEPGRLVVHQLLPSAPSTDKRWPS
jgi:hypothetical protein